MDTIIRDSYSSCLNIRPHELAAIVEELNSLGCHKCIVPKGRALAMQGDRADCLFLILSGQIKVVVSDTEGQEKTLALHDKVIIVGESGFFSQGSYNASMIAKTELEYIRIDRATLDAVFRSNPNFVWLLADSMGKKLYLLTNEVSRLSFDNIRLRLMRRIYELAEEAGVTNTSGEILIPISLTDGELANMLGSSREIVCRYLNELRRRDVIHRDKHYIIVSDIDALSHMINTET